MRQFLENRKRNRDETIENVIGQKLMAGYDTASSCAAKSYSKCHNQEEWNVTSVTCAQTTHLYLTPETQHLHRRTYKCVNVTWADGTSVLFFHTYGWSIRPMKTHLTLGSLALSLWRLFIGGGGWHYKDTLIPPPRPHRLMSTWLSQRPTAKLVIFPSVTFTAEATLRYSYDMNTCAGAWRGVLLLLWGRRSVYRVNAGGTKYNQSVLRRILRWSFAESKWQKQNCTYIVQKEVLLSTQTHLSPYLDPVWSMWGMNSRKN